MLRSSNKEYYHFLYLKVRDVRLVSKDGIIRPETFYKYLMVWYNVDVMGYTMSQVCQDNCSLFVPSRGIRRCQKVEMVQHLFKLKNIIIFLLFGFWHGEHQEDNDNLLLSLRGISLSWYTGESPPLMNNFS